MFVIGRRILGLEAASLLSLLSPMKVDEMELQIVTFDRNAAVGGGYVLFALGVLMTYVFSQCMERLAPTI